MGQSLEQDLNWLSLNPDSIDPRSFDPASGWLEADGSPVRRDPQREHQIAAGHLSTLSGIEPDYYRSIGDTAESLGGLEKECRFSFAIVARQEARNLELLLEELSEQRDTDGKPLDGETYEVNILINREAGDEDDGSERTVKDFVDSKIDGSPKINYHDLVLPSHKANYGYVLRLLGDATMQRIVNRGPVEQAHYVHTTDADTSAVSPLLVDTAVQTLDSNPHIDALVGEIGMDTDILSTNDHLMLKRLTWEYVYEALRGDDLAFGTNPNAHYRANRIVTSGGNTTYAAEALALVRGFRPQEIGQDADTGERIALARSTNDTPNLAVIGLSGQRVEVSPRRLMLGSVQGETAYEDFDDPEEIARVRSMSRDELIMHASQSPLATLTEENSGSLKGDIESWYNGFFREVSPSLDVGRNGFRKVLDQLGFKRTDYTFDTDDTGQDTLTILRFANVIDMQRSRNQVE